MALAGLRELAPGEPEVARTLLAATRDADLRVRRAAVTALAALIEPPPAVFDRLNALVSDARTTRAAGWPRPRWPASPRSRSALTARRLGYARPA